MRRRPHVGVLHLRKPGIKGALVAIHDNVGPAQNLRHERERVHIRGRAWLIGFVSSFSLLLGEGEGGGVVGGAPAVAKTNHDGAQELLIVRIKVDLLWVGWVGWVGGEGKDGGLNVLMYAMDGWEEDGAKEESGWVGGWVGGKTYLGVVVREVHGVGDGAELGGWAFGVLWLLLGGAKGRQKRFSFEADGRTQSSLVVLLLLYLIQNGVPVPIHDDSRFSSSSLLLFLLFLFWVALPAAQEAAVSCLEVWVFGMQAVPNGVVGCGGRGGRGKRDGRGAERT